MNNRYLVVDTETANGLEDPLVYDIGFAIIDKFGKVYESRSFLIYDTFISEKDMMKTAYYADKISQYEIDLKRGKHKLVKLTTAQRELSRMARKHKVKAIIAHNMRFDSNSTNTTLRWLTGSKYRYFFPYGIPIWCTMTMARQTIGKLEEYKEFSKELYQSNKVSMKAEDIYRWLINDKSYKEEHTGLEDVYIESKIFAKCIEIAERDNLKMRKSHYEGGDTVKWLPKKTDIQKRIERMAKYQINI